MFSHHEVTAGNAFNTADVIISLVKMDQGSRFVEIGIIARVHPYSDLGVSSRCVKGKAGF